jgi:hypothetical protein
VAGAPRTLIHVNRRRAERRIFRSLSPGEVNMMHTLEVGQELEFIEPATAHGRVIEKGTRVRVGHIMTEVQEPDVTLIVLGGPSITTLIVPKHIVTLHCRPVETPR